MGAAKRKTESAITYKNLNKWTTILVTINAKIEVGKIVCSTEANVINVESFVAAESYNSAPCMDEL